MSDIDINNSKRKTKKKSNWPFILVFLLGFGILMYPIITRWYYRVESKNVISTFDSEKEKLSKEEVKRRMELAKAYNSTLHNEVTKDPYSDEKKKEGKVEYARMIELREYIGHVQIPAIDVDVPIYAVTTAYYLDESGSGETADEIQKVQWIDPIPEKIVGKNILVVDEVDDSRVTAEFVLRELQKENFAEVGFAVIHNKIKEKRGVIPEGVHYYAGLEVQDWWVNYPWDATDIDAHNHRAAHKVEAA